MSLYTYRLIPLQLGAPVGSVSGIVWSWQPDEAPNPVVG